MPLPPNLFQYGTSELSQDAFLSWLAHWGDQSLSKINNDMHKAGQSFLRMLTNGRDFKSATINVAQQIAKVDIVIEAEWPDDKKHIIVIEDKTYSPEHSNQLQRYKEDIQDKYKELSNESFTFIYLKTGEPIMPPSSDGWVLKTRKDLLSCIENYSNAHPVLTEFYQYMKQREEDFNSWKTAEAFPIKNKLFQTENGKIPIACWGFYTKLKASINPPKHLSEGEQSSFTRLNYVPNARGGFACFTTGWTPLGKGFYTFIQISQERDAYLRIANWNEKITKEEVSAIVEELKEQFSDLNLSQSWEKASKRAGKSQRALVLKDAVVISASGTVDFEKTLCNILASIEDLHIVAGQLVK